MGQDKIEIFHGERGGVIRLSFLAPSPPFLCMGRLDVRDVL